MLQTEIITIDPRRCVLLEENARYMKPETFQRLVANIKRDGCLSQIPFAAPLGHYTAEDPIQTWEDGVWKWEVLSGNHRVKGSIVAGLETIQLQVTRQPLDPSQRLAIQLSHNAITGEDDPEILRRLFEKIDDVDWRAYSGLDDKALGLIEQPKITGLSEANLDFQTVQYLFLPDEAEKVLSVFEAAKSAITGDAVLLARFAEYQRLMDGIEAAGAANGVRNVAVSLLCMLDVFERHLVDLQSGYTADDGSAKHKGWVPLCSVAGVTKVPAATAVQMNRALDAMVARGELDSDKRWRGLERLCSEYMGGSSAKSKE